MAKHLTLPSGAQMPTVGLGTWQAAEDGELEGAVEAALEAGYRYFDAAYIYGNEAGIGRVIREWVDEGKVARDELFVSTKLPMTGMRAEDVPYFLGLSLANLQVDYVDLYLVHVPFGMLREGCANTEQVMAGEVGGVALDMNTDHVAIWKAMEAEVEAGRARAIGVSNFNERQIARVLEHCSIAPANHQIEVHLYLQQPELIAFCLDKGMTVTAYSPLGSPGSNKWLTTAKGEELPDLLGLPEVTEIAERLSKTPAQVLLRHLVQKGLAVVPKSTNPERIRSNIYIYDFELTDDDMAILDDLDRGEDGRILNMALIEGVKDHPEYPWD